MVFKFIRSSSIRFYFFYFSENSNEINLVNNTFLDIFQTNKDLKQIIKNNRDDKRLKIITAVETNPLTDDLNLEDLKQNSEKVLQIILCDIMPDYRKYNINLNNNNIISDFDVNIYLKEFQSNYISKNMNEKFLLIGYKIIPNKYVMNDENESEDLTYEVFLRCRDDSEIGKIEFELIANDISKIILIEEKKAELKYKSMYLSKIAHDLKNPIISIQQLVREFYDNYSKEFAFNTKQKIKDSFKYLKQICSFTDYLLILIKDLDFFSRLQIEENMPINKERVDFDEICAYSREIADVLLLKFNRPMNVQFFIENNLPNNLILISDEIKIKQILTNLFSNSVKSTNNGEIKIKLDLIKKINFDNNSNLDEGNNYIKFEISDTGIGMTNQQLLNINLPFKKSSGADVKYGAGLGLFIVRQLLKQFNSELTIESKLGEGTKMSFILPCSIEEYGSYEHKTTVKEPFQEFNINFDKKLIPSSLEEDIEEINFADRRNRNTQYQIRKRSAENQLDFLKEELEYNIDINQPQLNINYIIFVDEEKLTRKSSIRVLEKAAEKINKKIKVFEAEDGIECIFLTYKLIKNGFKVSAIVSDEMMNHMNGTTAAEVLKRVKNLNTNNIPYFLLTAYPDVENKFIDFVFTKPLNIRDAELILNFNKDQNI